jgi:hypothetical protein
MYTAVILVLNPFFYSLRNEDIKRALKRHFGIEVRKTPLILTLKKCP